MTCQQNTFNDSLETISTTFGMKGFYVLVIFRFCDVLKKILLFISECNADIDDGSCCTSSNLCALGEGDCDDDTDCAGNLVCGTDNCVNFDSSWPSTSDCCTTGK